MKIHHDKLRVFRNNFGSFDMVDQQLRRLKDENIEFGISSVIGRHNFNDLDNIFQFFVSEYNPKSLGVNFMKAPAENEKWFQYMITPKEYVSSIYKTFKKYRKLGLFMELPYRKLKPIIEKNFRYYDCGAAAGTTINIDSKGNIGPCKSFLIMEKVYSNKLIKKNMDVTLNVFKNRAPVNQKDMCHNCPAIAICGNGCAYSAYIDSDDYMGIDKSACEYSQIFHREIMNDLFELVFEKIDNHFGFYFITKEDRLKLLGKVVINKESLSSSIGHET